MLRPCSDNRYALFGHPEIRRLYKPKNKTKLLYENIPKLDQSMFSSLIPK